MSGECGVRNAEWKPQCVCFAVKEEARPFHGLAGNWPGCKVLLKGMGRRNAERAIRAALALEKPGRVLSCGFAGGLDPSLPAGTVLFAADQLPGLEAALLAAGARKGSFHCVGRVAATAEDKKVLRAATGADAVEMESQW